MPTPSNAIDLTASGVVTFSGTAFSASAITQHDVLVGGSSNAITSVAPSATSGIPLVSNGSSADPSFTTAVVAGGGTGNTTFTAYSVIAAGTTATGAFQNVSGVGTSGQVLTSAGASALPTWTSAGNLVKISTQAASSSSSLSFNLNASYISYKLIGRDVTWSNAGSTLGIQVSTDGGSTYKTTNYSSGMNYSNANSATLSNSTATDRMLIGIQATAFGQFITAELSHFEESSTPAVAGQFTDSAFGYFGGKYETTAITANNFKILASAGTFSGTFTLYGYLE